MSKDPTNTEYLMVAIITLLLLIFTARVIDVFESSFRIDANHEQIEE